MSDYELRRILCMIGIILTTSTVHAAPAFVVGLSSAIGTSGVTQTINTTGANFYAAAVSGASGFAPTLTDSSSNIWTLVKSTVSTNTGLILYYSSNVVTSASYKLTLAAGSFSSICFGAFSGMQTSPTPFQTFTSTSVSNGTTMTYPTITPSGSSLMTAGASVNGAETISMNTSYVQASTQAFVSGVAYGCGLDYLATSSANGPSWTFSVNTDIAGVNAAFTAGALIGINPRQIIIIQ